MSLAFELFSTNNRVSKYRLTQLDCPHSRASSGQHRNGKYFCRQQLSPAATLLPGLMVYVVGCVVEVLGTHSVQQYQWTQ